MNKLITAITTGVFLCAITLGARADGVRVLTFTPQQTDIYREVRVTGTVSAAHEANLSVSVAGLVATLGGETGDMVVAGDPLLTLDAELNTLALASSQALQQQAIAALADAERRLSEAEYLGPKGSIAKTQIDNLRAEVTGKRAALAKASADVGYQQALLGRHTLRAPFAGVISERQVDVGEWITPGANTFTLVSLDDLRVDLRVTEDYLGAITHDARIRFALDADRDVRHEGRLLTSVPVAEENNRTFLVRITAVKPVPGMRPGMSVNATLKLPTDRRGLVIPRDALVQTDDGRLSVWTVGPDPRTPVATERFVRTGEAFEEQTEIIDGLPPGEAVIVTGNQGLRPGQALLAGDEH